MARLSNALFRAVPRTLQRRSMPLTALAVASFCLSLLGCSGGEQGTGGTGGGAATATGTGGAGGGGVVCGAIVCDANATCAESPEGPVCSCKPKFTGDGKTCTPVCDAGFMPSGASCVDVDECANGSATCDPNAQCTNTPGGYTCACKSGFTGDGKTCTDIDECAAGTARCSVHATCTNTQGSFTCMCDAGSQGNGKTCVVGAALTVGGGGGCFIKPDHTLWCWGTNALGEVGDGTQLERPAPVKVGAASDWVAVSSGYEHTCGLHADGSAQCWGKNLSGQLGIGSAAVTLAPATIPMTTWDTISTGYDHSCGIEPDGTLWCWGNDSDGQLGIGNQPNQLAPAKVGADTDWIAVSAGQQATCALKKNGDLYCWGSDNFGQLGNGAAPASDTPVHVGAASWRSVASSQALACGVQTNGTLWCWGNDDVGQLGDGGYTSVDAPTQVGTDTDWSDVAPGIGLEVCARKSSGDVLCWGNDAYGEVADGVTSRTPTTPAPIPGTGWLGVAVGQGHACALPANGGVSCWGIDEEGQLGDGRDADFFVPAPVSSADTFLSLSVGGDMSCAIRADHTLWCWGLNAFAGLSPTRTRVDVPLQVGIASDWESVDVAVHHVCATKLGHTLWCWGDDTNDVLGTGFPGAIYDTPQQVGTGTDWRQISVGAELSCGVRTGGTLWCWGHGPVGDGTSNDAPAPVKVGSASDWVSVSTGEGFACGLRTGNVLSCWGLNGAGQIGDGSNTTALAPVIVAAGSQWLSVETSGLGVGGSTCAIRDDHALFCWGDGTTSPTRVGTATWDSVRVGSTHRCAIAAGVLSCWGENGDGQIGNGVKGAAVATPLPIGAANDWADVQPSWFSDTGADAYFTVGLHADGSLSSWGAKPDGRLGNDKAFEELPRAVALP